jgi:hypothetical protein
MDGQYFDRAVQVLGQGMDRRRALVGLVGAALGGLLGADVRPTEAKQSKGKRPPDDSVTLCHHAGRRRRHPITVPAHAAATHRARHGDFAFDVEAGECCTAADCGEGSLCQIIVDPQSGAGSGTCAAVCSEACAAICAHPFSSGCACFSVLNGEEIACVDLSGPCEDTCTGNDQCAAGFVCTVSPCCNHPAETGVCNPPCPVSSCLCARGAEVCAYGGAGGFVECAFGYGAGGPSANAGQVPPAP